MRLLFCLLLLLFSRMAFAAADGQVVVLEISGAIGPATADYFIRGVETANEQNAQFVVLRMDTPGGLDSAMRDMIKQILGSKIPVVTFVHPAGARAASAGTYILYASHVAVMSPATNLGAATPIAIGGMPGSPKPQDQPAKEKDRDEKSDQSADAPKTDTPKATEEDWMSDATRRKAVFDAAAYIRGLAQLRGRNAEWAEKAVREAVSLSADEAQRIRVIDLIATDTDDLLMKLDGREIKVSEDETVTLRTGDIEVVEIQPDWRNRFLATITSPSVAYLLMLIGIYGLLLEFYNPGTLIPGIATDIDDLLMKLDGREIKVSEDETVKLRTSDIEIVEIQPDWRNRFLATITSPSVAYLLMLIGIYGLLLEFYNPGTLIPGIAGAICLLTALYAFQMLPINYVGVALILLGIAFVIAELFVTSYGALGAGGAIAFIVGSVMLIDTEVPEFQLPLGLIIGVSVLSVVAVLGIVGMAMKARERAVVSGVEELVGAEGEALDDFDGKGWIRVHSETWKALSTTPIKRGQKVKVTAVKGLELSVEAADEEQKTH